jgi:hypothetical protein
MPAATVQELLDFEAQLDAALADLLAPASAPSTYQLAGHTTTAELVTPRLEYELSIGDLAGPAGTAQLRAAPRDAVAINGTFLFRYVYDHAKTSEAVAGAIRGYLRAVLAPSAGGLNLTNLPYLEITHLGEISAARGRFKDEREKLLSEWVSNWSFSFQIRESAWPV